MTIYKQILILQAVKSCYVLNSFKLSQEIYIMTSLSYPNKLSLIYSHSLFDTGFDGLFELVYGIYDMAHCTTKK